MKVGSCLSWWSGGDLCSVVCLNGKALTLAKASAAEEKKTKKDLEHDAPVMLFQGVGRTGQ